MSVTEAMSGLAKAAPWVADWLEPETTVIEAGAPAVMLNGVLATLMLPSAASVAVSW